MRQVHKDYIIVGAGIIISNNFWTIPSRMNGIGLGDRWKEYATETGENAVSAPRDEENPEAYVAGDIAAPTMQNIYHITIQKVDMVDKYVLPLPNL